MACVSWNSIVFEVEGSKRRAGNCKNINSINHRIDGGLLKLLWIQHIEAVGSPRSKCSTFSGGYREPSTLNPEPSDL